MEFLQKVVPLHKEFAKILNQCSFFMLSELINKHEVSAANRLIDKASSVAIVTHISPDGDALGSSLAMKHYLTSLGKDPVAVVVPNKFPQFLAWLPDADKIITFENSEAEATVILNEADLIVSLDFNDAKRIGKMGDVLLNSQAAKLMIDHHIEPAGFADVNISYPLSSSTCELVFRFICQSGNFQTISQPIAQCLYTGMMTDTGNFSYNSQNPELYNIVAILAEAGVNKDDIYNRVFNTYSAERLRLVGYCLYHKMKLYRFNKVYTVALITLSRPELMRFNFQSGDSEGIVNMPMQIDTVHYSCFMREDVDKIKVSFRSQGDRPVNEFAAQFFAGGGHKNAAGGEFYGKLEDAVQLFEKNLNRLINPESLKQ